MGDKDLVEKVCADIDAMGRARADATRHDLTLERAEDDESELDVDVGRARAVADHAIGDLEDVEEADAEAEVEDYLNGKGGNECWPVREVGGKRKEGTLLAYLALIWSSSASTVFLEKSSGSTMTRSVKELCGGREVSGVGAGEEDRGGLRG